MHRSGSFINIKRKGFHTTTNKMHRLQESGQKQSYRVVCHQKRSHVIFVYCCCLLTFSTLGVPTTTVNPAYDHVNDEIRMNPASSGTPVNTQSVPPFFTIDNFLPTATEGGATSYCKRKNKKIRYEIETETKNKQQARGSYVDTLGGSTLLTVTFVEINIGNRL